MALFVGIDVSKEKFDACGIGDDGTKVFSVVCPTNREGFEKLVLQLPETALIGTQLRRQQRCAIHRHVP
jgi:transposase